MQAGREGQGPDELGGGGEALGEAHGHIERRARAAVTESPLAALGREAGDVDARRRRRGQRGCGPCSRSPRRRRGRGGGAFGGGGRSLRCRTKGQVCHKCITVPRQCPLRVGDTSAVIDSLQRRRRTRVDLEVLGHPLPVHEEGGLVLVKVQEHAQRVCVQRKAGR